jgi:geranylgeranyl diphosphate synthase type I
MRQHETVLARERLASFGARLDDRLAAQSRAWEGRSLEGTGHLAPRELIRSVTGLTLRGGKRVRPALAWAAATCFDHGLDEGALLDAVSSVEWLQTYLLIHDDVMDDDPVRRGGDAVHVALGKLAGDRGVGRSLAILAGDIGCAMAQEALVCADLPRDRVLPAMRELITMQWEVIQGQHLDMVGGASPERIHDAKTASYTTRGPVRLGAVLAGAAPVEVDRLERYGTPLGRAFQVRDDLLGVFGKGAATGKPVGADLRAGKRTDLVESALAAADSRQAAALQAVLGRADATEAQVQAACAVIEETGARRRSEAVIDAATRDALAALDGGGLREEGAAFLRGVAMLLAGRDR